jgi:hypothetical protein
MWAIQEDTKLIAIKQRISNTTPEGVRIIQKAQGLRPEFNEIRSSKALRETVKDYTEGKGAFKISPIGWVASKKKTGRWKVVFHYQTENKEYMEAEWEYNPQTNRLYPFEMFNALRFWARNGQYN